MLKLIRQFTFHHPKEILQPTFWLLFVQAFRILLAVLAYVAIVLLGRAFSPPYTLDSDLLMKISVVGMGYIILQFTVELISHYYTYGRAYNDTAHKRIAYIQKLRRQSLGFFSSKESGELISSFAGDFANVEFTMCYWLPYPIGVGFLLLISFVGMLFFDWRMAVAIFAMLPICALLMLQIAKVKEKHSRSVMEAKTRAATQLNEYLAVLAAALKHWKRRFPTCAENPCVTKPLQEAFPPYAPHLSSSSSPLHLPQARIC